MRGLAATPIIFEIAKARFRRALPRFLSRSALVVAAAVIITARVYLLFWRDFQASLGWARQWLIDGISFDPVCGLVAL